MSWTLIAAKGGIYLVKGVSAMLIKLRDNVVALSELNKSVVASCWYRLTFKSGYRDKTKGNLSVDYTATPTGFGHFEYTGDEMDEMDETDERLHPF